MHMAASATCTVTGSPHDMHTMLMYMVHKLTIHTGVVTTVTVSI